MPTESPSDGSISLEIDPLRNEFRSDITESKFLADHLAQTQAQLRVTLALCSVFYIGFFVNFTVIFPLLRDNPMIQYFQLAHERYRAV